ncbi:MAG: hypothetical protein KGJ23_07480 [Euryarchaeota archaeon]|nr:hypothetical protein [Euryarchaeota archaeon]MDE1836440.1 hypothetical protein [Euryarchaeota archaeon]MDE1879045.1 hypothetical protein [Euryarchaeota archaeon]MDE2044188.1 hypothetical protein [Thermoplasmata archaeon]
MAPTTKRSNAVERDLCGAVQIAPGLAVAIVPRGGLTLFAVGRDRVVRRFRLSPPPAVRPREGP